MWDTPKGSVMFEPEIFTISIFPMPCTSRAAIKLLSDITYFIKNLPALPYISLFKMNEEGGTSSVHFVRKKSQMMQKNTESEE